VRGWAAQALRGAGPAFKEVPMARPRRKLTRAEREQRRRRDRERLTEATRSLLSSDGTRSWLRTRAAAHHYTLLI
jgi:hypothetical protein